VLSLFFGLFNKNKAKVTVTSINLRFMGETHSIQGRAVKEKIFQVEIPFQNKIGNDLLPDNLKGPSISLNRLTVAPPFQLVDFDPKLPVEIGYLSRTVFKLRVRAPDVTYEGPLAITFGNELADTVNLNIKAILLNTKGQQLELENSGMIISMQKSQIFKRTVQLFKIMKFGDSIAQISVNKPFELVSTEPTLPLTVNKKDSYILGIFIKAPDYNYAGNLEITFK
jgi:hypothetical protein